MKKSEDEIVKNSRSRKKQYKHLKEDQIASKNHCEIT